ncbi:response regulator [Segetibacter sp. 3557_3]|uniref:hybrid sensor histidine kinase/response regulator n=1 Tax=Segetibacter sp. 3557_3 TaxID=2547429 RepID=UPI001058D4FF|nr:response regulator [Segetibacter sp. 3557_3]TDH29152.1 response regulator [Segetibacter sp. 3557_3]
MKSRLYLGFIAAIVLVLVVGFNSYLTFKKQNAETLKVKNTYKMLNQMQTIQLLLLDMETGRRGFRSTNEPRFLKPYVIAIRKIHPELYRLKRMAVDQEVKTRIPLLEKHIDELLKFWNGLPVDLSVLSSEYISRLMDSERQRMEVIREEISDITNIEKGLLTQAEQENSQAIANASLALIISVALILIIVLTLIFFIFREFSTRKRAEEELKDNFQQLERVNRESNEKNWLLQGVAEVNNSLHRDTGYTNLSQSILETIIRYLNLDGGAFYMYNEEDKSLVLTARHALPENLQPVYRLNEGFVGQAMLTRQIIIAHVSPAYITGDAGHSGEKPGQALYFPIYFDDEVKGVMELATFGLFEGRHKRLLDVICDNVAVAINSAQARENVLRLLKELQEHKEALEQQQEKLRRSNEELSHQTEVLQHSEEELKVQEEELRQINAELEEKNATIESARRALELKARELEITGKYKSEFLANMSHELRTPLNSVLILAKLLADNKDQNLSEKQVNHAKIIHKSGADLLHLINDILDLSKIEAGKVDLNFEELPLRSITTDIEQLFNVVAEEKHIKFDIIVDDDVPLTIQTDKQRLGQVLKNLLSNAFKFTAPNGCITLHFSKKSEGGSDVMEIAVSDNGIGISASQQMLIFEAFQQADGATNRKYGGTGLGLSISKELVRMLGGNIKLESTEGKGSRFKVTIPIFKGTSKDTAKTLNIRNLHSEAPVTPSGLVDDRFDIKPGDKVLLVIEDDDTFAKIVRQFGFSHDFKTILALTGNEGVQLAKKFKPGAVILDMHLPDIDGATVLQMIKSDNELKNIPVHIITARDNPTILPGAFAYLQKPLSKKDLDNVFVLIGEIIQNDVKRVLLITGEHLKDNVLNKLIADRQLDVQCEVAVSVEEAIEKTNNTRYDCVIADIGKNVGPGITALNRLHDHMAPGIPVIIYLDEDITPGDDLQLKKISDVVVRSSSWSPERLMDELELFLYKVQQETNMPEKKHKVVALGDGILKGKKALLVDDDMRNIFALTAALESEEMEILTACDGREAVQQLSDASPVDIVLMDIMMPNMDGYQAMDYIRKQMSLTRLPIIALTAKAMTEDKEKCIAAGASDYISKPLDMQKLKSLMKVWLS